MAELDGTARALARIPSGLFVLCAGREPPGLAMLVSFVQQVGFQPPAISVALNKQRDRALALLRAERSFCLAVIGDGDRALLARYAGGAGDGDPFEGVDAATAANGVRYPAAACAHLVCELRAEVDCGDHWLLCAEVSGGDAVAAGKPWVHLRKNGLSY
ncbi:MAG TPA: flavin reductase family protein [Planctomycetota bacterium]|nr:flavin reductase family protein [Planctomycetota bacterium]